jgi:N-acyl homoserine lactone hydrolase
MFTHPTRSQQPDQHAPGFLGNDDLVARITKRTLEDPELTPFGEANDLMLDGSLLLLPTPGHTPGSMSLLVRRAVGAPLLMVGDLTYEVELLDAGRIPGVGDRGGLRKASAMVRELRARHPELVVLPAHDPGAYRHLLSHITDRHPWETR